MIEILFSFWGIFFLTIAFLCVMFTHWGLNTETPQRLALGSDGLTVPYIRQGNKPQWAVTYRDLPLAAVAVSKLFLARYNTFIRVTVRLTFLAAVTVSLYILLSYVGLNIFQTLFRVIWDGLQNVAETWPSIDLSWSAVTEVGILIVLLIFGCLILALVWSFLYYIVWGGWLIPQVFTAWCLALGLVREWKWFREKQRCRKLEPFP